MVKDDFLKELEVLGLELEKDTLIDLILSQQDLIEYYQEQISVQNKVINLQQESILLLMNMKGIK